MPGGVRDTLKLARRLLPGADGYKLGALVEAFKLAEGLPEDLTPHRATYDVLVTARLFVRLATLPDTRPLSLEELRGDAPGGGQDDTPPCSDCSHGLFVSVDGPSGAGKSTIVHHLAQLLVAAGEEVHVTAEPSSGPIGALAAELTETVTGHALACLYAADRYHHIETEIAPRLTTGHIVISDRYIASGLVIQRFDDVDPMFLWQLNQEAKRPDLAVILDADPDVIAERLHERGPHNRFQLSPRSSHTEVGYYQQAADILANAGVNVLRVDCSSRPPEQSAALIRDRLMTLLAPTEVVS